VDAIRRRVRGGRHPSERDQEKRESVPSDVQRYLDDALAGAREEGRKEQADRFVSWLRHPGTIDRVAEILYEARTGRMWRTAEEIDRISYIANARAAIGYLMFDRPQ
jgi:hypothetical protein